MSPRRATAYACCVVATVVGAGCTDPGSSNPWHQGFVERVVGRQAARPMLDGGPVDKAAQLVTTTPIKHLVVIFSENISFDHYFGTYPNAENNPGETRFEAARDTPSPNNLVTPLDPMNGFAPVAGVDLLRSNPNLTTANGDGAANPFRLGPIHASTQDMGHNYTQEQQAANGGAMDRFPSYAGTPGPPPGPPSPPAASTQGLIMAYYDGNTVRALWTLAQEFSLNDNSWTSIFGPSTLGAINLISGQTNGFDRTTKDPSTMGGATPDGNGGYTLIGNNDPIDDVCSGGDQVSFEGRNVGDLLNAKGISWGWFEGGFDLGIVNANGSTGCARSSPQTAEYAAAIPTDYIPHHEPFQYFASTANPSHARPTSVQAIGSTFEQDGTTVDPAHHQYDSHDFFDALKAGNFPAVSYLKAPGFQDAHAGYSNPIDEQDFITQVVSAVRARPEWESTAIIIAYDDSDGWYDHQAPPIVNRSTGDADALNGEHLCTDAGAQQRGPARLTPLLGADGKPALGRCGYGTRIPLLVISPFAKKNYIDHTLTDQTSVLRFIEDNWLGGERIQRGGSFDTIAGTIGNMFLF